jgi:hypothetical protein
MKQLLRSSAFLILCLLSSGFSEKKTPAPSGAVACPCTVFQPSDVPATPLTNDGQAIEVGMKFRASVSGNVTGLRYYKGAGTTGTHTGHLWSSGGTMLAEVTFSGETASGWQEMAFPTPVAIAANTTYIISQHSSSGDYAFTNPFFTAAVLNGPLSGLANGDDGPNGVYKYSASPVFPDQNFMSANYWVDVVFSENLPVPPPEGPGGPILVVSAAANPFSRYPVEMLRAQGFNEFLALDISAVTAAVLDGYDVVILGETTLTAAQVTMFSDWVNDDGGTFIAFRPDAQLAALLGISSAGGTLSDKYLLVNTASDPGAGIVNQTIQFHGTADHYNLNGATSLATLYSNANTATAYPAATLRDVGANGGKAAAFTYDLARSVVYTRQGNPAWAGQERDGEAGPIRPDDLFFGNASGDPQPDWIDLNKVAIPQADEQMHLLSNIIALGNLHKKPLPRFWFLPSGHKAAIVMTGDDHANGGTVARFNQYVSLSPSNTAQAVADWVAVRGSSYIYPGTPITDAQALAFENQGFEIGLHLNTGCVNWTPASLLSDFNTQLASLAAQLPSIAPTSTHRTHCIAWSDWASQPEIETSLGIRLDVNYYYWPASWVLDRSGMFTGSGFPMRFAKLDGSLIDCYQVTTQMPDESGLTFPGFCDELLDRAIGAEGYYGVFCANMHTDANSSPGSDAIIASALARDVPVISAKQMLTWLDGRNGSSFESIAWSSNDLSFTIDAAAGALNLRGMVPLLSDDGVLVGLTKDGNPHPYTTQTVKGIAYAFFSATDGDYVASYDVDNTPPVITNIVATPNAGGTATITWETDELADSRADYGTSPGSLNLNESNAALVTNHSIVLSGLAAATTYYFRVTSEDGAGNSATSPNPPAAPLSFTMPYGPCADDETAADFALGTTGANTLVVPDGNGAVILQPAVNEEFPGPALPAGWTQGDWTGGTTTFSGGQVIVNGTHIATNASYPPGTSIEFEATFRAGPFQNVGFSVDFNFNSPWATIGTGSAGNGVYARSSSGSDISLGAGLLGSTHRYRIVWNTNDFQFYVDDSATPAATIAFAVGSNMVVQISDFPNDGAALDVNWMRFSPYAGTGSFTSRVHDAGQVSLWNNASWTESLPAGTSLQIFQRQGNTPVPDGSWSAFSLIASNGANVGGTSRYIQYRADLATTDPARTPVLRDLEIVCSPPPTPTFEGTIKWHHDGTTGVQNATVNLTGAGTGSDVTDLNGDYSIAANVGGNFFITPVKNINKLNGVTTADATAVQQHVANTVPITDAYKQVAADVNKSNSITTLDATIINQSLLGNPAALAQFKTSWRFTPTTPALVIPPWGFSEKITLNGVGGGLQAGNDFLGIKTGDLVTTFANPANFGAGEPMVLNAQDRWLEMGETVTVDFKANQLEDLAAFQLALKFDVEKLELTDIQPLAALPLTVDNFGTHNISEGEIRAVWSQAEGVLVGEAAPVFSLKFNVLQSGSKLSEALSLHEDALPALAYTGELAESGVELNFLGPTGTGDPAGPTGTGGLQLFQNRPNPFSGATVIGFVLPESCEAQLRVYNVSGRVLTEKKAQYAVGKHEETFDLEGASGVLWYELATPFGTLARKMVAAK